MKSVIMLAALIAIPIIIFLNPLIRLIIFHPVKVTLYAAIDTINYFKEKKFNIANTGHIKCYCGLFGKGKTLSAVRDICDIYERYNDVKIFDFSRKKWVTQKVHILSNVHLNGIPYEDFKSLEQIVYVSQKYKKFDEKNNTRTVHYCLIDEASVQLNNRDWKKNVDPLFLNTLLTCRHHFIEIILTSQRFNHLDALLRQVCDSVILVNKKWRFELLNYYDAYDLEQAGSPEKIKPFMKSGFIVEQKHFDSYDTLACVDNLKKSFEDGKMITEEEILTLQRNGSIVPITEPEKKKTLLNINR